MKNIKLNKFDLFQQYEISNQFKIIGGTWQATTNSCGSDSYDPDTHDPKYGCINSVTGEYMDFKHSCPKPPASE